MATLLEKYGKMKTELDFEVTTSKLAPEQIWAYQELLYRIEVLQVCQMFQSAAPLSAEVKDLSLHYKMLNAYIENLMLERKPGAGSDENQKELCDTAHGNLRRIVDDYRKRFSSFSPGNDACRYSKEISAVLQTVLPAWLQYRQACTTIQKEGVQ